MQQRSPRPYPVPPQPFQASAEADLPLSSPHSAHSPLPRTEFPSPGTRHHYQSSTSHSKGKLAGKPVPVSDVTHDVSHGSLSRSQQQSSSQPHSPPQYKNAVLVFAMAQVFVVWLVVTAVVYLQDIALQPSLGSGGKLRGTGESGGGYVKGEGGGNEIFRRIGKRLRHSCPLHPPVCQKESDIIPESLRDLNGSSSKNKDNLPTVFFLAGIEGSGHKFFEQVFRNLPVNFSIVAFEPDLHLTSEPDQLNVHPREATKFASCPKLPYARPLKQYAYEMAHRLMEAGPGPYVRARDSFPLGRVRTPLARPDLVSMLLLDGHLFHLKVVVLLRDLANSVKSAARMGYHGQDVGLQVRIVEDSMVYLDASIRMLPCGRYIVLDFDWVVEEPEVAASALADFMGYNITSDDVRSAVNSARRTKPVHNAPLPHFGTALSLEEFFALRAEMWPLLTASRASPYFWPKEPQDWPIRSEFGMENSKDRSEEFIYL